MQLSAGGFGVRRDRCIAIVKSGEISFEERAALCGKSHILTPGVNSGRSAFYQFLAGHRLPAMTSCLRDIGCQGQCGNPEDFSPRREAVQREEHVPRRFAEQLSGKHPIARPAGIINPAR